MQAAENTVWRSWRCSWLGLGLEGMWHAVLEKMWGKWLRQDAESSWIHRKALFWVTQGLGTELRTDSSMEASDKWAIPIADEV